MLRLAREGANMPTDSYHFPDEDLAALAARLGEALGLTLHERLSPMEGPSFTNVSPAELAAIVARRAPVPTLSLELRRDVNPDYGQFEPRRPGLPLVLKVTGSDEERRAVAARLAGLRSA